MKKLLVAMLFIAVGISSNIQATKNKVRYFLGGGYKEGFNKYTDNGHDLTKCYNYCNKYNNFLNQLKFAGCYDGCNDANS